MRNTLVHPGGLLAGSGWLNGPESGPADVSRVARSIA
jgi:hypothetical protein